ncbi:hypothetical protein Avbf_01870 [Armadillidium vulgare]|nr:hypothetical protein Avbf_01870 [Armadillidium vulgare]
MFSGIVVFCIVQRFFTWVTY